MRTSIRFDALFDPLCDLLRSTTCLIRANTGEALLFFGHAVTGHAKCCHRDRHPAMRAFRALVDPSYVKAMRLRKRKPTAFRKLVYVFRQEPGKLQ
jgi:hypothetical protein